MSEEKTKSGDLTADDFYDKDFLGKSDPVEVERLKERLERSDYAEELRQQQSGMNREHLYSGVFDGGPPELDDPVYLHRGETIKDFIEYPIHPFFSPGMQLSWPIARVAVSPPSIVERIQRQMRLQYEIGGSVCVQHEWYVSDLDLLLAQTNHGQAIDPDKAFTIETDQGTITLRSNRRLDVGEFVSIDIPEE